MPPLQQRSCRSRQDIFTHPLVTASYRTAENGQPCYTDDDGQTRVLTSDERETRDESVEAARNMCAACPIRDACLRWTLTEPPVAGITAGITRNEAKQVRKKLGVAEAPTMNPSDTLNDDSKRGQHNHAALAEHRASSQEVLSHYGKGDLASAVDQIVNDRSKRRTPANGRRRKQQQATSAANQSTRTQPAVSGSQRRSSMQRTPSGRACVSGRDGQQMSLFATAQSGNRAHRQGAGRTDKRAETATTRTSAAPTTPQTASLFECA